MLSVRASPFFYIYKCIIINKGTGAPVECRLPHMRSRERGAISPLKCHEDVVEDTFRRTVVWGAAACKRDLGWQEETKICALNLQQSRRQKQEPPACEKEPEALIPTFTNVPAPLL